MNIAHQFTGGMPLVRDLRDNFIRAWKPSAREIPQHFCAIFAESLHQPPISLRNLYRRSAKLSTQTAVPVEVAHASGTAALTVNQQVGGGDWVLLGVFPFAAGSTGNVLLKTAGATVKAIFFD
jgi:hypothetical protein